MGIFEIVEQLKAAGYEDDCLVNRQIIVTSSTRLAAINCDITSMFMYSDIIVVDNFILRDRTGCLKGEHLTCSVMKATIEKKSCKESR